jgi:sirohydrochlorin ferrochelatase
MVVSDASAYLLVSHGSRDPRPQQAIARLADLVSQRLSPSAPLGTAVLECGPLPLHQQIQHFVAKTQPRSITHLRLLPLFLLPGVHVMEDIPAEVAIAQQSLDSALSIQICPYLGSHPDLVTRLTEFLDSSERMTHTARILVAHGSRRPGGNRPVEAIAAQLQVLPAYWSVPPSLETQLALQVQQGYEQIEILPYFLFSGGITDALAQAVAEFAQRFPQVSLQLRSPIGTTPALADIVVELLANPQVGSKKKI